MIDLPKDVIVKLDDETLVTYHDTYKTTGILVIPNFFGNDFAERLHKFYNGGIPDDWWHLRTSPGNNLTRCTDDNNEKMTKEWAIAGDAINGSDLAYRFFQTTEHATSCYCEDCVVKELFKSKEMIDMINLLTNEGVTTTNSIFGSKYSSECFLAKHSDQGNGAVAHVWNCTKNWLSTWGGMLHFLEDDWNGIKKVVVPTFNSMVLFSVPKDGRPHFVSSVGADVTAIRTAVSGWFR